MACRKRRAAPEPQVRTTTRPRAASAPPNRANRQPERKPSKKRDQPVKTRNEPVTKKRGRPTKTKPQIELEPVSEQEQEPNNQEAPPKKRGRPAKVHVEVTTRKRGKMPKMQSVKEPLTESPAEPSEEPELAEPEPTETESPKEPEPTEQPEESIKKRGRPPKSLSEPPLEPKQRRLSRMSIRYRGRTSSMRPLFKLSENGGEERTLIDDTLVDFYLTEYMVNDVFNDEQRSDIHVFHSFLYTGLRDKIGKKLNMKMEKTELAELFKTLYPKLSPSVFEKKILVVPVYISQPKHWLLVLIHNPLGATFRSKEPVETEPTSLLHSRPVEHLDDECRILLLDSLRGAHELKAQLKEHYKMIFQCLMFFVQMMAAARGEEAVGNRIKPVICRVARQKNQVDCGFFMMSLAEYFTTRFTQWTSWSTLALVFLKTDEETQKRMWSDEPREAVDRLLETLRVEN